MVPPSTLDSVESVKRSTMTLAQRLSIAALLVAGGGIAVSPAAQAHNDHHHRSHKKQKAYNKGYKRGYKEAIENSQRRHVRPYYRSYSPVYGPMVSPMPRRVIVAPAPWMSPVHPFHHGNRIHVGHGFLL